MLETTAITLLELHNGHLSLEFEEDDIPEAAKTIRTLFGKVDQKQYVMVSDVAFGEATFTFQMADLHSMRIKAKP